MTPEEFKMHFELFLMDHGAYEEFMECCNKVDYEYHLKKLSVRVLDMSLYWFDTPSGHAYWSDLHVKFKRIATKLLNQQ